MPVRRFIVAGMQRSGTTVTYECLRGHPQVTAERDELDARLFGMDLSNGARRREVPAMFDWLAGGQQRDTAARGIKTALGDSRSAMNLVCSLQETLPDVTVVLVEREDLVAQFGSFRRAQQTGVWHSTDRPGSVRDDGRTDLPAAAFESYADECQRSIAHVRALHATHEVVELSYERDIAGGLDAEKLFTALHLEPLEPSWLSLTKVSPPPREFIANYDELTERAADLVTSAAELARERDRHRAAMLCDSAVFLLYHAGYCLHTGRHHDVLESCVAGLQRGEPLSDEERRWAFGMLELAIAALADPVLARATVDDLAGRYRDDPHWNFLAALVANFTGDPSTGIAHLRHAVSLDPGHQRAATRLREMTR